MYKTKLELLAMSGKEIAEYCKWLEQNDQIAKNNGFEYVEWCQSELMDALDELGISDEEFDALLRSVCK